MLYTQGGKIRDLPDLPNPFRDKLTDDRIGEVMIGGRWIKLRIGSYKDLGVTVTFLSEDGRIYNTRAENVQVKVEGAE